VDASSSTNPPRVPFLMCSCVLPSSGRFGPSRAKVGVGFRRVRLVQALPSFPPLRWSCSVVRRPPLFFLFSCLSRVCPFRARCVVLVFSRSLFFCVPLFAFWLSKFHFTFIVISLSCSFHLPCCGGACVCVCHLYRSKTSILCRGATAHLPMLPNEATEDVVDGFMDA